jgi:hypothetical protein
MESINTLETYDFDPFLYKFWWQHLTGQLAKSFLTREISSPMI